MIRVERLGMGFASPVHFAFIRVPVNLSSLISEEASLAILFFG